jgi:hypothetical protein
MKYASLRATPDRVAITPSSRAPKATRTVSEDNANRDAVLVLTLKNTYCADSPFARSAKSYCAPSIGST